MSTENLAIILAPVLIAFPEDDPMRGVALNQVRKGGRKRGGRKRKKRKKRKKRRGGGERGKEKGKER